MNDDRHSHWWRTKRPRSGVARRYRRLLNRSLDARVRDELDVIVDRRRAGI